MVVQFCLSFSSSRWPSACPWRSVWSRIRSLHAGFPHPDDQLARISSRVWTPFTLLCIPGFTFAGNLMNQGAAFLRSCWTLQMHCWSHHRRSGLMQTFWHPWSSNT